MNGLNDLVKISNLVGNNINYIQGGGGNTSIKLNHYDMAIKSSGSKLKEMTLENGICNVNFQDINVYLGELPDNDDLFSKRMSSFANKNQKPSIETGFHSMLGNFVIHTHSVFVNTLLCATEGKEMIENLFPESIWIDYATPGLGITKLLQSQLEQNPPNLESGLTIFLQNHGVIISGQSGDSAYTLHEEVNNKVRYEFNLPKFNIGDESNYFTEETLFPDQAVFDQNSNNSSAHENLLAARYIVDAIRSIGLTPNFLEKDEVNKLRNLESEKFRVNIDGNNQT